MVISPSFHLLAQWQALRSLEQALSSRGSGLRFCHGSVIEQFEELIKSYRFGVLYSHQETGNLLSYETDLAVANWCSHHGIRWVECNASSVQRGGNAASKRKKRGTSDPRMTSPIGDPVLLKSPKNKTLFKSVPSLDEFGKLGNIHDCHLLVDRVQKVDERSALSTLRSFWIIEVGVFGRDIIAKHSLRLWISTLRSFGLGDNQSENHFQRVED